MCIDAICSPAYGSLGSIDSSKIQPDQPGHATCLTFASGTGEFEKVGSPFGNDRRRGPQHIVTSLASPIFVNHIGQRDTANRPKPPHGVADRKQGEWTPDGNPSAASASFSNCKYSVVRVAPKPSALATNSMFCTAG
jgi:hypothetical protein